MLITDGKNAIFAIGEGKSLPEDKHFTFIDLFSGIVGFHQGCMANGGICVFASEWDQYAQETTGTRFSIASEVFRGMWLVHSFCSPEMRNVRRTSTTTKSLSRSKT